MEEPLKIVVDWGCSPYFGWGVYCLNLAIEWAKRRDVIGAAAGDVKGDALALDPLTRKAVMPFLLRSGRGVPRDALHLHALGNGLLPESEAPIGVIFFEQPLDEAAIERARKYRLLVAGSTWNAEVLRGHGLDNVVTILQGVDHSLFHPAPKRGLHPDKFLIFSGGKAEPRKGQDLVVRAFRAFAQRHREAMLVTAWHSPHAAPAGMDLDLRGFEGRVIDAGQVPNGAMAPVYRECDVGLFPSRAEGGTNLVAMECLACGLPTILSDNTGHRDLRLVAGAIMLRRQTPAPDQWSEWGESDLDEILAALEQQFGLWRASHRGPRGALPGLSWRRTSDELIDAIKPFAAAKAAA